MRRIRLERFARGMAALVLVLMIGVPPLAAQEDDSSELPMIPPEVEQFADEWPLANRDYSNTRATTDAEIDSSNVDALGIAWVYPILGIGSYGGAASNPLIADGIVYFQDLASNVVALDLETGEQIWFAEFDEVVLGPNGPALGYGKLIINSSVDSFAALDLETGETLWEQLTGERPTGAFQGVLYGGYAFMSTQAGLGGQGEVGYKTYEGGASGFLVTLDPETGDTVWEFQVVEEGFWGNPEVNSGGGLWYPPAIDTETGVTFWGTGNPAPFAGTLEFPNGSSRPGPNLYTNSILAFDHASGEMLWYNQVKPHDLFDLDFQSSPILTTAEIDGEERDIVIGAGKLGRIIAFDRETGDILWNTPVGIHQNDDLDELPMDEPVEVYPGIQGGIETPMAYADGVVYAATINMSATHTATGWDAETPGEATSRTSATMRHDEGTSEAVAVDVNTGDILWSTELEQVNYGGMTIVNDLVFTALFDGTVLALSREDGSIVWEYQVPGGIIAWPAVAGDTIIYPAGLGSTPVLVALRLGAAEVAPGDGAATPMPTPWG